MSMIPLDPIGYAVNLSTGTIHTRYPGEHAGQAQRTRTERGVLTLLDGHKPTICAVCYPSPRYATPARSEPLQKRRSGSKAKNPTQDEQDEVMGRHLARDYGVPE